MLMKGNLHQPAGSLGVDERAQLPRSSSQKPPKDTGEAPSPTLKVPLGCSAHRSIETDMKPIPSPRGLQLVTIGKLTRGRSAESSHQPCAAVALSASTCEMRGLNQGGISTRLQGACDSLKQGCSSNSSSKLESGDLSPGSFSSSLPP